LSSDFSRPGRNALGDDTVVPGEDSDHGLPRDRRRAAPGYGGQLLAQVLQAPEGTGRLREPPLALSRLGGGPSVNGSEPPEGGVEVAQRVTSTELVGKAPASTATVSTVSGVLSVPAPNMYLLKMA
jgi:hypothetical protein